MFFSHQFCFFFFLRTCVFFSYQTDDVGSRWDYPMPKKKKKQNVQEVQVKKYGIENKPVNQKRKYVQERRIF